MAHAKTYLRPPTTSFAPTFDIRKADETTLKWLAPRLNRGSLNELDAISKFQPVSILLKDMERKRVIVDTAKPTRPLIVFDMAMAVEQPTMIFWSALADGLTTSDEYWGASAYANGFLNHVNKAYPTILTHVDARNVRQIAWLVR